MSAGSGKVSGSSPLERGLRPGRAPSRGGSGGSRNAADGGAIAGVAAGTEAEAQGHSIGVAPRQAALVIEPEVRGSNPLPRTTPFSPERLYFVTRSDLSEGRRAAQLIHAMDEWTALHGPQRGTVIVYEVPSEADLHLVWDHVGRDGAVFHEPDFDGQATAFATAHGPLDLPLLGSALAKAKGSWKRKARRRARAAEAVMRPPKVDRPSPPTIFDSLE